MRKVPTIRLAAVMTAAVAAGSLTGAQPAAATSAYGCSWPRVCFYKYESDFLAHAPTASFQDLGYWQTLGSRSAGSVVVYNSRNDDGALLQFGGGTWCLRPNTREYLSPWYTDGYVTKIKIMDSATC